MLPVQSIQKGNIEMENWANRKTLILGRSEMIGLLKPGEYNDCVEQAYRMHGEGRFYMDPKGHIVLDRFPGEWEAMPSYIEQPHAAACKWVSIREWNRERFNLPTVFSILIYTHPETGFPLAIVDGSYHTVMRTGAAAAVSTKWMARKDSRKLAIVGAGHMAEGALATCNEVFPWSEVRVWSRSQETLDHFVKEQQPKYDSFEIKPSTNVEQVVRGADVVVTITPARVQASTSMWSYPTPLRAITRSRGAPASTPASTRLRLITSASKRAASSRATGAPAARSSSSTSTSGASCSARHASASKAADPSGPRKSPESPTRNERAATRR